MPIRSTPLFPPGPHPTPSSDFVKRPARPPIYNPYDKFTQPEFDVWIGNITGALRKALGHVDDDEDPNRGVDSLQGTQPPVSDQASGSELSDDSSFEDSFAELKSRHAKGKSRDPREGPGLGGRFQPIELLSDSEEEEGENTEGEADSEKGGEESGSEDYDDQGDYDSGDHEEATDEEDAPGELEGYDSEGSGIVKLSAKDPSPDIIELISDDDKEDSKERIDSDVEPEALGVDNNQIYAEDANGTHSANYVQASKVDHSMLRKRYYDEKDYNENDENVDPKQSFDDEGKEFPPLNELPEMFELPDPWEGPRTYAEDFYAGGDMRGPTSDSVVLSPSHLTPVHDLPQDSEPVGMVLTPIATPSDLPTPDRSQHPIFNLMVETEDNDILPNSSPPVSSPVEDRSRRMNAPLGFNFIGEDPLDELYMEDDHHIVSSAVHKQDEYERDAEVSSHHETLLPAAAEDTRDSVSPGREAPSDHSEHLDWNWPPAFPQGKFASRAGHIESSSAKDGSDDEALDSDEDNQGPLPLGTSDLLYNDLDELGPTCEQNGGENYDEDYDVSLENRAISHAENTIATAETISEDVEEIVNDSIFDFLSNPEADVLQASGSVDQPNVEPISSTPSHIADVDTVATLGQQDSDAVSSGKHTTTASDVASRQDMPETTLVPSYDTFSPDQFTSEAEKAEAIVANTTTEVEGRDSGSDIHQVLENAVPQAWEPEVINPITMMAVDLLHDSWVMPENDIVATSLSTYEPPEIQSSHSQLHSGIDNGIQEPSSVEKQAEQEGINSSGEIQDQLETQEHTSGVDQAISSPARIPALGTIGSPLPPFISFSPLHSPPVLVNVPGSPHLVLSPRDAPDGPVPVSVPVSSLILQELSRRLSSSDTNSNGLIVPRDEEDSPSPKRPDTREPAYDNESKAQGDDEREDNSRDQEIPVIDSQERDRAFDIEPLEDDQTSNVSGDSVHEAIHLPTDIPRSPVEGMDTSLPDNNDYDGRTEIPKVSSSHTLLDGHDQSPLEDALPSNSAQLRGSESPQHVTDIIEPQEQSDPNAQQRDTSSPLVDEDKKAAKNDIDLVEPSSQPDFTQNSSMPSPSVEDAFKLMGNDSQVAPGAISEGENEDSVDTEEIIEDRDPQGALVDQPTQDSPEARVKEEHAPGVSANNVPTSSSASSDESLSAEIRSPRTKRKRASSTSTPIRLTRSMSSKDLMAGTRPNDQPKKIKKKEHTSHDTVSGLGNTSDVESTSSGATSASRMLGPSSRHSSRASSVISSAPSTSSLSIQPSPTVDRFAMHALHPAVPPPIFHTHGGLRHHHPPKPPSTSSQPEHVTFSSTTAPPKDKDKETLPATPAAAVPNITRSKISSSSPVTRSNCRFHKISLPKEEGGTRVSFVVPGCSLGSAELMHEQDILDHGPASYEDYKYLIGNIESLEFSSYLVGVLRQLVGVDLLRENEVFYLANPGEDVPKKSKRSSAVSRLASRDAPSTVLRSTPGSPLVPVTSRRSPAASLVRAPISAAGSTSTSASFRLRARGSEGDSFSTYSPSDGNLTDPDVDAVPEAKRRKKLTKVAGVDHPESISGTSKQTTTDHNIRRRRSRRLNSDAAAYKPGTDEENESADEDGIIDKVRRRRNHRGIKRSRAEQTGNDEDQSESKTKKQKGPP